MPSDQKDLPLPDPELPKPEKDLPLPEKELTAGDDDDKQSTKSRPEEAQVDKDFEPSQVYKVAPEVEPKEEKQTNRKKLFLSSFIFGVIFVVILIVIGIDIFINKQNSKTQNIQVTKTVVKPATPTPTPDPTADWETYSDDGFQLQYPSNWIFVKAPVNGSQTGAARDKLGYGLAGRKEIQKVSFAQDNNHKTQFEIDVYNNVKNETLQQMIDNDLTQHENASPNDRKIVEYLTVDRSQAIRYSSFGLDHQETRIAFINNGKIYNIVFDENNPNDSNFEMNKTIYAKMLSAFKFTDAVSPTAATSAENFCPNPNGMSYEEALTIAKQSECAVQGTILVTKQCNPNGTGYWWLDLRPSTPKSGCNPACVVDVATKKAEINWRCTGLAN